MKRISIIKKTNLIVVLLVVIIGVIFVYAVYARNVRNIDRETEQTVEYVFDLMDNTLSASYQQVEDLIRNISLNQEVRHYYQKPKSVDAIENARRFSEYLDTLQSANTITKMIKLYCLDGELIYRAGDSPIEMSKDILPKNIEQLLHANKGRQYWMRDRIADEDVIRVFSYIYNLNTVELMGILEVQISSRFLFFNQTNHLETNLEVFLAEDGGNCIWQMGQMKSEEVYEMSRKGDTFYCAEEQYTIYRREARAGIGTFYLVKATNDVKKMNRNFLLYISCIFCVISVFIVAIASRVLKHTLTPIVKLTKLVNHMDSEAGLRALEQQEIDKIKERQDEVGLLATSFDNLLKKIEASIISSRQAARYKRRLEMELLMSQIKPHFLYNTIEAICGISMMGKSEDVCRIAKSLGTFYRISLSKGKFILPVKTELEHIKCYLDIECIRSNYSFNYYIHMQEGIEERPILKMILQPIVENAVVHGIRGMEGSGGVISVAASMDSDGNLRFEVMDNGRGMDPAILEQLNKGSYQSREENGFGMNNVRERIQIYYTEGYTLCYESTVNCGTKVTLCLNGEPEKEE